MAAVTCVCFGTEGFVFEPAFPRKKEKEGDQSFTIAMLCVCVRDASSALSTSNQSTGFHAVLLFLLSVTATWRLATFR